MNDTTTTPVYVFDLDGVITDPRNSTLDKEAVSHIDSLLKSGIYVAINTGRSYEWVENNLIRTLRSNTVSDFSHLYIVCEKGGESVAWNGSDFVAQPSRFALDTEAYTKTQAIFESEKTQLQSMFWDATKRTMATIEKQPSADLAVFRTEQTALTAQLNAAFAGKDVKVDPTTIATDVESPFAGKHAGAELIYEWANKTMPMHPDTFISFGDSVSDYEMARYFAQQGQTSHFVFVGSANDQFNEDNNVVLLRTMARYAEGTKEYFEHTATKETSV